MAARRARLLEAALHEYGSRGYSATGVKDICRAAGLTDRYFYESFADGRELLVAVLDAVTDRLFSVVADAAMSAPKQPETQVRATVGAFVRELADDPEGARIVFVEAASAGGEAEQHMRSTLRRFAALVAASARAYLPASIPDEQVKLGALSMVGSIERVMIEWQDGELAVTVDQIIEHIVAMFLAAGYVAGVAPPPRQTGAGAGALEEVTEDEQS